MKTQQQDKNFVGRDLPALNLDIAASKGNHLIDRRGKKYIDFLMGWCVGNVGWSNRQVQVAVGNFKGPDYVNPCYLYRPWGELAELLAKITPGRLKKSFRATGGTEAVEIALQAAMSHTQRRKFISIEGSYHGHSIGAMSVGMSGFREHYNNLLPDCYKIKPPLDEKAANEAEKLIGKKDIAALIMEPVVCNLGVLIPAGTFMKKIAAACRANGTVIIADEVATGFGRTGKLFASEHYGWKPDIMCLAKGITGGYGGLGATIMTPEVAKSMEWDFSFYSTFGWHPRNTAAAIANIKYILNKKEVLLKNANEMGKYFAKRLAAMNFKYPAQIRIKGLAIGVEFKTPGYAAEITEKCQSKGLLFSTLGERMFTLFPALNIDMKTAKSGLDILEQCL